MFEQFFLQADAFRVFGIKVYDQDFLELIFRLALVLVTSWFIIMKVYKPGRTKPEFIFTYLIFTPIVFFICHLFSKVDLSIGFAFGLFAVFSILRYRTRQIPVREMSYMFIVIALAVINALATKKVSYVELFFTNGFIAFLTWWAETNYRKQNTTSKTINYVNMENLKPENEDYLLSELEEIVGKEIISYKIKNIDYLTESASIRVTYAKED